MFARIISLEKEIDSIRKRKRAPSPPVSDADEEVDSQGSEDEGEEEEESAEESKPYEPKLPREAPALSPELLEEISLGRIGRFVPESNVLRRNLYAKKWKAPASLFLQAKDQPVSEPKRQHWHLPGKEVSPSQLVDLFNKAEGVVEHTHLSMFFGSETVTKRNWRAAACRKKRRST